VVDRHPATGHWLSLLALAVAVWMHPAAIPPALTDLLVDRLPQDGAVALWAVFLGLTVVGSLLAYGMARIGLWTSRDTLDTLRPGLRTFARGLLIGTVFLTVGLVSGEGVGVALGIAAIVLAAMSIGLQPGAYWWWH
jgi:hypothetical protein